MFPIRNMFASRKSARRRSALPLRIVAPSEALEDRTLLSANVLATVDSSVNTAFEKTELTFTLDSASAKTVAFIATGTGGGLDPTSIHVETADGVWIGTGTALENFGGSTASLRLVTLAPGEYRLKIGGAGGTVGTFHVEALMIGDLNGDHSVTNSELQQAILAANQSLFNPFGPSLYRAEFDALMDGAVDNYDVQYITGNLGSANATLIGDREPPVIAVDLLNDNGPSDTDNVTNDPTIVGSVTDASDIVAFQGRFDSNGAFVDLLGQLDASGNFTLTEAELINLGGLLDLDDGDHTLELIATDERGNATPAPVVFTFTLDRDAPDAPTTLDLEAASDTGTSDTDDITNDDTPTLTSDITSGDTIRIFSSIDGFVGSAVANSPVSVTTTELTEGTHEFTATVVDPAGNESAVSAVLLTVVVDVTAPDTPVFNLDGSNDETPTTPTTPVNLVGTTSADMVVELFDNGAPALQTVNSDGTTGDFTFTNVPLAFGENDFRVVATDVAGNFSEFTRTVIRNDDPTVANAPGNVNVDEDAPDSIVDLSNVFDDLNLVEGDVLTLSVEGNTDTGLVTTNLVGTNLTLDFQDDQNGTATITLRATDTFNAFVETTLTVNVAAVNDAPVNTVPGAQTTNEDTDLVFAGANAITFADLDATEGDGLLDVTLTVNNGTLALGGIGGLQNVVGDGTGTVSFTATAADANAAVNGLTYSPDLNFNGGDTLTVTTNDRGNFGADPGNTGDANSEQDVDTVAITVDAVNDDPTVANAIADVTVDEDAPNTVIDLTPVFADVDIATNGDSLDFTFDDDSTQIDTDEFTATIAGNTLTIDYKDDANGGPVTLTVKATDTGGLSVTDAFDVTVNPVNDNPFVDTPIADVTVAEDAANTVINLDDAFADVDIATNGDSLSFTFDDDSTQIDNALFTASISGSTLTIDYKDDANGGPITLTVKATDTGPLSVTDAFDVTVTPVNDAPMAGNTTANTTEDTAVDIDVSSVIDDIDGDDLTISVVSATNGVAVVTDPNNTPSDPTDDVITFTPAQDFNDTRGTATITYKVNDGSLDSNEATITVGVTAVNDEPTVANAIADVTVDEDAPNTVIDLANVFDDVDFGDTPADTLTFTFDDDSTQVDNALFTASISGSTLTIDYKDDANGGPIALTVKATDADTEAVTDAFDVTVNPVNDQPTVANAIADVTVNEDAPNTVIDLTPVFADVDIATNGDSLSFTFDDDSTQIDNALFTASISGSTLTIDYKDDANGGPITVGVRATDSGTLSVDDFFDVTVNPVNDQPTVANAIADVTVDEDAPNTVIDLTPVFADVDIATNGDSLSFTFDDDSTQIDNALFTASISGSTLTIDYKDDANGGPITLTVKATDTGPLSVTDAFDVTVTPVNDAPTAGNTTANTTEDTAVDIDVSSVIDDIDGDDLTISVVSATNGVAVVTDPNNTPSDPTDDVITFTPSANFNDTRGTATITYKVNDGSLDSNEATITVGVTPVNDDPTEDTPIADVTVAEDASNTVIDLSTAFTDVDFGDTPADSLTLTFDDDSTEVDNGLFTATISGSTLTIDYKDDANGDPVTLTVKATDTATASATDAFDVTITPVNDTPTVVVPGAQNVDEDATLDITGVEVGDLDSGANDVTVTLAVTEGTLTVDTSGTTTVQNNGTATVTLVGTVAEINATLANGSSGFSFSPTANFNGGDTLTVTINDEGHTGADPGLTGGANDEVASATVDITVNPINDTPTVTVPGAQTVDEDTTLNVIGVQVDDIDAGAAFVTVVLVASQGDITVNPIVPVIGNGTGTVAIAGTIAEINAILANSGNGFEYTPNANFNGGDTITVTINDGGSTGADPGLTGGPTDETASDTINVTVTPVNDAPVNLFDGGTFVGGEELTVSEILTLAVGNSLSISDVDAGAGQLTTTITVDEGTLSATGDQSADPATVVLVGTVDQINANLATLVFTPRDYAPVELPDAVTLTITTNDGGNTGADPGNTADANSEEDTDTLTINVVDDQPPTVANPIADVTNDEDDPNRVIDLTGVFTDIEDDDATLALDVFANDNPTLVDASVNGFDLTLDFLADQNGTAEITVRATDSAGNVTDDTFIVTVNPVNDTPTVTVPGSAPTVGEDDALNVTGVQVGDIDAGAGDVLVQLQANNGDITVTPAGSVVVSDNGTALVTLSGTVAEINAILANSGNGFAYTPDANFNGTETITVRINDNGNTGADPGLTGDPDDEIATDTFDITVTPINDAPVNAVPGAQTTDEDIDLVFGGANAITFADLDAAEGDGLLDVTLTVNDGTLALGGIGGLQNVVGDGTGTVTFTATAANANAAVNGLTYSPSLNFNGEDALTITTNDRGNFGADPGITGDANSEQDVDTVDITVTPVNDAPTAGDIGANTTEDTAVDIDVSSVIDDIDGDDLTISVVSATNGVAVVTDPNNTPSDPTDDVITFTPAQDFNDSRGTATITYKVNDGSLDSNEATITVGVTAVNDEPTVANAIADVTVDEDAPNTVIDLANVFDDVDFGDTPADTLTITFDDDSTQVDNALFTASISGSTLTIDYKDDANGGPVTLSVKATDSDTEAVTDAFDVTVNPVNDQPTVANAIADVTVDEDAPNTVIDLGPVFADVDIATNGDSLSFTFDDDSTQIDNALFTASISGSTLTIDYKDDANGGPITVGVRATDSGTLSVDDFFDVTVNPVNDQPTVANAIADVTVDEDAANTVIDLGPVFADVDIATNGDSLSFTFDDDSTQIDNALFTASISGSTLTIDYKDDANGGPITVGVRATDSGTLSVDDFFDVTVNPVNDQPTVANAIADVTVAEDAPNTVIDLTPVFADVDIATNGDSLSFTFDDDSTQIDNALFTASISGSTLTIDYKDDANGGPITLTVKATDTGPLSVTDAFDVTVTPVNDAPTAGNTTANTTEDTAVDIDVSSVIDDIDGDDLTISVVSATNGVAVVTDPNNTPSDPTDDVITFTPSANFNDTRGTATITYKVNDGTVDSANATITVDVAAANDDPTVANQLADVSASPGAADLVIDVAPVFDDVDFGDTPADSLAFTVQVSNASANDVVTATIPNGSSNLTLDFGTTVGTADVTVTATDDSGAQVTDTFRVTLSDVTTLEFEVVVREQLTPESEFDFFRQAAPDGEDGLGHFELDTTNDSFAYAFRLLVDFDFNSSDGDATNDVTAFQVIDESNGSTVVFDLLADGTFNTANDSFTGVWEAGEQGVSISDFIDELRAGELTTQVTLSSGAVVEIGGSHLTPTAELNELPQSITEVLDNDTYVVELYVRDLVIPDAGSQGLFAVNVQLDFDAGLVGLPTEISSLSIFDSFGFRDVDISPGEIQIGGFTILPTVADEAVYSLVGAFSFTATADGTLTLATLATEFDNTRIDSGAVAESEISFGSTNLDQVASSLFTVVDSSITISGTVGGEAVSAQAVGTDMGVFTNASTVEVVLDDLANPTTIQFVETILDFEENATNIAPDPANLGVVGTAPGDFGFSQDVTDPDIIAFDPVLQIALRELIVGISSTAELNLVDDGNGGFTFDGTSLDYVLTEGDEQHHTVLTGLGNLVTGQGFTELDGMSLVDNGAADPILSINGNTLSIEFFLNHTLNVTIDGEESSFTAVGGYTVEFAVPAPLTGTAVATPGITVGTSVRRSATVTNNEDHVATLPPSDSWISEWDDHWVEIWVRTDGRGAQSAEATLSYDEAAFTATQVVFSETFEDFRLSEIDDTTGTVTLSATTPDVGVGVDGYVLLARVRMEALETDEVAMDESDPLAATPSVLEVGIEATIALADGTNAIATPTPTTRTELRPVVWDLDDNGRIDFADVSILIGSFGESVHTSATAYAWWFDTDRDGVVDFDDFAAMAGNYGLTKASGAFVTFPEAYDRGWHGSDIAGVGDDPVDVVLDAAIGVWDTVLGQETGIEVQLVVRDLGSDLLGQAEILAIDENGIPTAGRITIDDDAAGLGWYSQVLTSDFDGSGLAVADSEADGRYDLMTVLLHELGHVLGFTEGYEPFAQNVVRNGNTVTYEGPDFTATLTNDGLHLDGTVHAGDVMNATLDPGVRKLPSELDAKILEAAYAVADANSGIPTGAAPLTASRPTEVATEALTPTITLLPSGGQDGGDEILPSAKDAIGVLAPVVPHVPHSAFNTSNATPRRRDDERTPVGPGEREPALEAEAPADVETIDLGFITADDVAPADADGVFTEWTGPIL